MTFLDSAKDAALSSSKILLKHFGTATIEFKGRIDLVTNADKESEKNIVNILKTRYPEHGFILEENDNIETDSDYTWIIDPIDGTNSFAHGYPFFSISIALQHNEKTIMGLVYNPLSKEMFYAELGKGAYLNGEKISVSKIDTLEKSLITTGFPYDRLESDDDNLKEFCRVAKKVQGIRRDGSAALDLCFVAAGRIEGYWEMKLKPMDSAAGILIVEESGGHVTDFGGVDKSFTHVVATNGLIHKELIDTMGGKQ